MSLRAVGQQTETLSRPDRLEDQSAHGTLGSGLAASSGRRSGLQLELKPKDLARKACISMPNERSRLAEEMRVIKQRLLRRLRWLRSEGTGDAHVPDTVLVTSADPHEGKSFIALNLALSLGFEGTDVLLVEADIANPTISRMLGVAPEAGLVDALADPETTVEDLVWSSPDHQIAFLPACREAKVEAGLLAGQPSRRLLDVLAQKYKGSIIIIDAPPLLAATEPIALAEHVATAVMVIEANRTTDSRLRSALDLLESVPDISLVLNKALQRHVENRLGDYYGAWTPPPKRRGRDRPDAGKE